MEQVIEAVRSHRVLWDPCLPEYRDTNARETAWSEIATCLGKEKKIVKEDWRKLRDSHRNAVSRRNTKSGQAAEKRKKWKYEDQMEFLLTTYQHRQGESNIPPSATPVDVDETLETASTTPPPHHGDDEEEGAENINDNSADQQGSSTEPSPMYREKRHREPRRQDKVLQFLAEKENRRQAVKMPDELDLFFASITKSVRNLPHHVQLRLKREIFNCVTQAEEEHEMTQTNYFNHDLISNEQQTAHYGPLQA